MMGRGAMLALGLTPLTLLLMAASPRAALTARLASPAYLSFAPIQRTPALKNGLGLEPAPVPDQDAYSPVEADSGAAVLQPALFQQKMQYRGDGFSAGSTAQGHEDKNNTPGLGFRLKMPVQ